MLTIAIFQLMAFMNGMKRFLTEADFPCTPPFWACKSTETPSNNK